MMDKLTCTGFEVVAEMIMMMTVFWGITPCSSKGVTLTSWKNAMPPFAWSKSE
jgi:hypothetical protein